MPRDPFAPITRKKRLRARVAREGRVRLDRFFAGAGGQYSYSGSLLGKANRLVVGLDLDAQRDGPDGVEGVAHGVKGTGDLLHAEPGVGAAVVFLFGSSWSSCTRTPLRCTVMRASAIFL